MKISSYPNVFFVLVTSVFFLVASTLYNKFFPSLSFLRPNLILLVVVYLAIYRNFLEGAGLSFFISYLETLHSPIFVGGTLFINMSIFLVLSFISRQVYIKNFRLIVIVVSSVMLAEKICFLTLIYIFRDISVMGWFAIKRLFIELPVNVVFSVPIFKFFRLLDHHTGVKEEKTDYFSGPIYLRKV